MTDLQQLEHDLLAAIGGAADEAALEGVRVAALGKKGRVSELLKGLGAMSPDERRAAGPAINGLKDRLAEALGRRRTLLVEAALDARLEADRVDVTLPVPASGIAAGRIHPVSQVTEEITAIFADLGFAVAEGPDIEDDEHNFTALNFPVGHPAREMHDTFFFRPDPATGERKLLRTHTSPVQIRTMRTQEPPIRVIIPGRTYRCDSDQTHTPMFHQVEGPDIEDDEHNFTALNFPVGHPAREMHDTFFFRPDPATGERKLLRTHTSPVQIRTMRSQEPPIRVIIPGRTYRCDSDQTHTPMFHQVEGLLIDRSSHLGHLKWILEEFCKAFFEVPKVEMRFRPSFFPFTEPSMEVDIRCRRRGNEIRFGEGDDWLEILGCGMVHPNVLRNCGLDPDAWQGFAWGMGIDRVAMLKYGMPDLRAFFEADVSWLTHYGFRPLDMPNLLGGLSA